LDCDVFVAQMTKIVFMDLAVVVETELTAAGFVDAAGAV
jgi:hypothetical protein